MPTTPNHVNVKHGRHKQEYPACSSEAEDWWRDQSVTMTVVASETETECKRFRQAVIVTE